MPYEPVSTFKHPASEKGKAIRALLESNGDSFFSCSFTKKDGSQRDMVCRLGVQRYLKGGESGTKDYQSYLNVFDTQKGQYRSINVDTVSSISMKGQRYEF